MTVTTELAPVDRAYAHVLQRQLVTSVGVAPSLLSELTNHDVECLLTYSGTLEDMSKWVITDLLIWAEEQAAREVGTRSGRAFWDFRDRLWDALLATCKLDISRHTAYNMVATGKTFPWDRRRHTHTLSFEHHRVLSSRTPEEQEYYLDLAEAGEWSVARLRQAVYGEGDSFHANMRVLPREDVWPEERIEREVYRAFSLPTRYDQIQQVRQLIQEVKETYQDGKAKHQEYPRTN